jgi:hypothetical protein
MIQKKGKDSIPKPTDAATAASNGEELMDDMNEETETMEENSKRAERGSQVYRKEKEGNRETSQKAYFHRRAN